MKQQQVRLSEIAALIGCPMPPGEDKAVSGVATLGEATPGDLSFLASEGFLRELGATRAAAVIVQRKLRLPKDLTAPVLLVDDADLAMAKVLKLFAPSVPAPAAGRHVTANIAATARVADDAAIGPYVIIGAGARIGRGCVLHAGVIVGDDVLIGDHCQIFPHVVIRERITIGNRVVIHAGSILGTDGFGYRWNGTEHQKIPQIGTVIIEDDVEIGSCVCIDRAKVGATRVGRGTKIDNLVQIGHNVQVGPHCIIVGQAGIAGSATLGAGVVLGGQSAVRDHVTLGDGVMLAACSGVMEDVEPKQIISGLPALPHRQSLREQAAIRRLPDLVAQVRKLTEELETIKKTLGERP